MSSSKPPLNCRLQMRSIWACLNISRFLSSQVWTESSKSLIVCTSVDPFPHNKICNLPKLKALVDDKLNATQNIEFVFHMVENIVGKGKLLVINISFFSTLRPFFVGGVK